jgi:hypothetical protein
MSGWGETDQVDTAVESRVSKSARNLSQSSTLGGRKRVTFRLSPVFPNPCRLGFNGYNVLTIYSHPAGDYAAALPTKRGSRCTAHSNKSSYCLPSLGWRHKK